MGFGSRGYNIIYAKNKMKIQDIPWITHTHTDCYDVCQIYNGQMPQFLWGDSFWDNHYYLIDKKRLENKEKYNLSGNFFHYDDEISYPRRLLNILVNIDSEYIVFDHEDMMLYEKANLNMINDALNSMYINNIDSVRFIKNINAKYNKLDDISSMEIIDPKSDWIFSIQPSIWKKDKLISILKKNLNVNIWDLEYKSQRVVRKLNIQIGVLAGNCKQRGMYHCDSEYYPYIATALFKGKWTISEYEKELSILFDKYNIDPLIRGGI